MNSSLVIVIFGASGDLTSRKLIPALYQLFLRKRLPQETRIVGVARSPLSHEQFRTHLETSARSSASKDWQQPRWEEFAQRVFYIPGDAANAGGLEALQSWLREREKDDSGRRLYYLSVGPDLYPEIVSRLGEAGMTQETAVPNGSADAGWRRLVIEKPFGRDLASAHALNAVLHQHFREHQVYRIDHYLGKETVQNLLAFRFANAIFEPVWNSNYVDHVQITVSEALRVEQRGAYYDRSGVLRDMFQSHILQLLTLVAMEAPARYAAQPLRNEKIKVLDAIPIYSPEEAAGNVVCGQYQGYCAEKGVAADSHTPTFAAVRLHIENWRWQGVPFYLRSGKGMSQRYSEVIVQFRRPPHMMFQLQNPGPIQANRFALCVQPDEGIHLNFQSKVPEQDGMTLRPADLEFHYRDAFPQVTIPEAYERLLLDVLQGDASLFMRSDEIERSWEIMDPIIAAAERRTAPTCSEYPVGFDGPPAAEGLLDRDGRKWIRSCHLDDSGKKENHTNPKR